MEDHVRAKKKRAHVTMVSSLLHCMPGSGGGPKKDNVVAMIRPISRWYSGHPLLGRCGSRPGESYLRHEGVPALQCGSIMPIMRTPIAVIGTVFSILTVLRKSLSAIQTNASFSVAKNQIMDVQWTSNSGETMPIDVLGKSEVRKQGAQITAMHCYAYIFSIWRRKFWVVSFSVNSRGGVLYRYDCGRVH